MKDFFDELGKKLTETAETVGKRTEEVVEIQKLRSQIRTMERSNERDIFDLGKMIYEKYKGGEIIDGDYLSMCEDISKRAETMAKYEEQVAWLRGLGICPNCQEHVEKYMAFCPKCGSKLEQEKEPDMKTDCGETAKTETDNAPEDITSEDIAPEAEADETADVEPKDIASAVEEAVKDTDGE